ncbi:unnamed protein product, partial [Amoebophrya sp. A25]
DWGSLPSSAVSRSVTDDGHLSDMRSGARVFLSPPQIAAASRRQASWGNPETDPWAAFAR